MIKNWVHDIIDGCGGLHDFEYYEMAVSNLPRDEAVATWVIRCLANPDCEGSDEVMKAILNRRTERRPHNDNPTVS